MKSGVLSFVVFGVLLAAGIQAKDESISFGTPACGKLSGGEALPCSGENYEAYHWLGCILGRNYLHPLLRDIVADAYAALIAKYPDIVWQYGETGWETGGKFRPHKTHRNGTSVDFFFPVMEGDRPSKLSISVFNKFGYGINFSPQGRLGDLTIHWQAMADHLMALREVGSKRGVGISRIFLSPALRKILMGKYPKLKPLESFFNQKPAWVLHDEHYHIDFTLPEKYRQPMKCE